MVKSDSATVPTSLKALCQLKGNNTNPFPRLLDAVFVGLRLNLRCHRRIQTHLNFVEITKALKTDVMKSRVKYDYDEVKHDNGCCRNG